MTDGMIGYEKYVKRHGVYQDRQVPFVAFHKRSNTGLSLTHLFEYC